MITFVLCCEAEIFSQRIIDKVFGVGGLGDDRFEFCSVLIAVFVPWGSSTCPCPWKESRIKHTVDMRVNWNLPFQNCSGSETSCSISRARSASSRVVESTHPGFPGRLEMRNVGVLEAGRVAGAKLS